MAEGSRLRRVARWALIRCRRRRSASLWLWTRTALVSASVLDDDKLTLISSMFPTGNIVKILAADIYVYMRIELKKEKHR